MYPSIGLKANNVIITVTFHKKRTESLEVPSILHMSALATIAMRVEEQSPSGMEVHVLVNKIL